MIYLMYGAAGALTVLILLAVGACIGWKANDALEKRGSKRAAVEATEEQRRQLAAQQKAFEDMLSYNQDTAYGTNRTLNGLGGGERYE